MYSQEEEGGSEFGMDMKKKLKQQEIALKKVSKQQILMNSKRKAFINCSVWILSCLQSWEHTSTKNLFLKCI
jgi:hypothetical protein